MIEINTAMTEQKAIDILSVAPIETIIRKNEQNKEYEAYVFNFENVIKRQRARVFLSHIGKYKKEIDPYSTKRYE